MSYICIKHRKPRDNDEYPTETERVFATKAQMCKWRLRHRNTDNTVEISILDDDEDLIYFFRKEPRLEEMYRKNGTITKYAAEMGM